MYYVAAQIVVSHSPHQPASPNHIPSTTAEADVTRSATEQPDVTMAPADPPVTHGPTGTTRSATEQPGVTAPAVPAVWTNTES